MSTTPLTARQQRLLQVIEDSLTKRGYVPTLQEMAHAMGIASLHGVKRHLLALERKGYIRRFPGRRRAIEITHHVLPIEGSIPILGRVAAGRPLLAVENQEGALSLGPALLGKGTHFALRVQGDSMIEEGIQEGDYVVVRQQDTADPGEIVVVLLGEEVTVKRLQQKGTSFFLEAANAAYAPIPLTSQSPSPRILGTVVGVYRDRRRRH
ncbi:MAG: transcriptional repressor LexA [Deltaproteobacteria bacterium]|nr:transcriptional repressor LexA [Deltaproteobacteria bacterium]